MILVALLLANLPPPQLPNEAEVRPVARGASPREERPWGVSGELGWNGLAGVGAVVARHLDAHFTLEAGVGIAAEAAKFGLRARYDFAASEWTPFLGAGFLYGTGYGDAVQSVDSSAGGSFGIKIGPSPFVQLVGGVEYQSRGGFAFHFAAGYARLLRDNFTVVSGTPTSDDLSAVRIAVGSGLVLSASLGYAF